MAETFSFEEASKPAPKSKSTFSFEEAKAPAVSDEERKITEAIGGEIQSGKAIGRGLVKGVVGGLGETEKALFQELPQMLGYQPLEKKTVLPTAEETGKFLGFKKTPEQYEPLEKTFQFAGELASPGAYGKVLGTAGKALARGAGAVGETVSAAVKPRALVETIAKPTSVSDVGEKIEETVVKKLDELVKTRSAEAEKLFGDYLTKGAQFEGEILNDYGKSLTDFYAKNAKSLSPSERKLMLDSIDRLRQRPTTLVGEGGQYVEAGMEALEKERRFLNDIAKGIDIKGAEAIPARFAQDLSKMLEGSITKFVPNEYKAATESYQVLSEPINRYNTVLGKKVAQRADDFLPNISKADAEKLPGAFFNSRRSINELRALTGDEKFVQEAARAHVANDLSRITESKEITKYLQQNMDWLQELPQLRSEIENVANTLRNAERVKIGAGATAAVAGVTGTTNLLGKLFP
jgi:hypothetical protein